jgi:serine phosphatase RsbU (regulator of sigma subunit)
MRIGTKILLLMLLITAGSSAVISWIVTLQVTHYETNRVNGQISQAIERYVRQLDDRAQQTGRIVGAMLEAPELRSLLQLADDPSGEAVRNNLKQFVFGRDVQRQLEAPQSPAFHVLLNPADEVLVASAAGDAKLEAYLASGKANWPVDAVLGAGTSAANARPLVVYLATPRGLFLAMGVPLRAQLDEPPTHAYFVGFKVDDAWTRDQLLADGSAADATGPPLDAWFVMDRAVVARGSAGPANGQFEAFTGDTTLKPVEGGPATAGNAGRVEFVSAGEHFLGQSFNLGQAGHLVLAASLDQALAPLHRLQRTILLIAAVTCAVAFVACRMIASMIARPIRELVAGTQRIAAGRFDTPVPTGRRDELGALAGSFNQMAEGLRERDMLREERVKIERDMSVARKIQRDILPKELPPCPRYDLAAYSLPAEATGGDIYDLVALTPDTSHPSLPCEAPPLVLLLADATGHGIGPALSVTQVRSMLRIGVRLRAGLEAVFSQINRQLCQDLGSGRFVTAFLGLLDPLRHRIDYHSAGQGPLLHFHAATGHFEWLNCSMLPLGVSEDAMSDGVKTMVIAPCDLVVLLTDGFYEYQGPDNDQFGRERVADVVLRHRESSAGELLAEILAAIRSFGKSAPQLDDMTALIIKRLPEDL